MDEQEFWCLLLPHRGRLVVADIYESYAEALLVGLEAQGAGKIGLFEILSAGEAEEAGAVVYF